MTKYKQREIRTSLEATLKSMPVVVLTGMRQVGKSTLLRNEPFLKNRRFIDLDDFAQLQAARQNPEALLAGKAAVTIDEAQKCPDLLTTIKQLVDRDRRPGQFLLSGSANFALLRDVSETLAGRAVYLRLHPFTRRETDGETAGEPFLARFLKSPQLPKKASRPIGEEEILLGGMPSVCLGQVKEPSIWFRGFEQTYLERDLRELSQVADLIAFRRLMKLAALRTGQILKVSELARDGGLNSVTASRYLDLVEASFLIRRIEPFLGNKTTRLVKSPKLYFADTGLTCHLAGIDRLDPTSDEPMRGALFETWAAQQLAGIIEARLPGVRLCFWNVQGRHEVDFILESGQQTTAIEVKAASRWGRRDLSGLRAFTAATPGCQAAILAHNGTEAVQLDDRLWAIPLASLLA